MLFSLILQNLMLLCYIVLGVLVFVLFLHSFLEVHHFLRVCLCVILAKISRKKLHVLAETSVTGICLASDIDFNLTHMNNARFLRELDFAKIDFAARTGLYKTIKKYGGDVVIGATTIRYRRFIKLFNKYVITTKIIYWDEQNIFAEHRFVTPSDNFINAVVLCRVRLINCNGDIIINELVNSFSDDDVESNKNEEKPELSLELVKWIESNEISSEILKNKPRL